MTGFPHLLAPGRIGAMTVRNRIVMSPMETMSGTPDGLPSERTRDYFAARAKGGVGLITLGANGVDPQHPETPGGLHTDRLDRLGVTVHVRAEVERITSGAVVFTPAGGVTRELACDSVVIAGSVEPHTGLFDALVDALPDNPVHAAGDCTGLGLIRKATEDGARAACAI